MSRPCFVDIDISAYHHNLAVLQARTKKSQCMAVVKANAYGHGIKHFRVLFDSIPAMAVSCLEEALELRELGFKNKILLLEGFFEAKELALIDLYQLTTVVRDEEQLKALTKHNFKNALSVWLKINTGMNRLGITPKKIGYFWDTLARIKAITRPIVLMTHFARADETNESMTLEQIKLFRKTIECYQSQAKISLCNSAGALAWPNAHGDWIRPGLASYGISPFPGTTAVEYGLKPVMRLYAQLIAIQDCAQGEKIGYGSNFTCPSAMKIGVVAIGYADGYPQQAENGTPLMLKGRTANLVGRVSMDMLTIDLSQHLDAKIGDEVVLWGPELPIETITKYFNTSPYELICGISNRVKRRAKG